MANDHNSPIAEPEMDLQDLTRCLERVFENRRAANATGSSSTSPSPISPLCEILIGLVSNHTSPRKQNGVRGFSFPTPGRCHGISPSSSASSDSSMSECVPGFLSANSRDVDRNNSSTVRQLQAAASARPIYGRGRSSSDCIAQGGTQPRVLGQEAVELMPNSSTPAPTTSGRGRAPSPPIPGGVPQTKIPKKRKRLSRKPFTRNVEASVEEFRATVQQFTGFKGLPATVVSPQPVQAANAVPLDVGLESRNPAAAARPGSSSTSMMSAVHSPSPTVSDRVPEAGFSIRGREASVSSDSSKSSSLNDCMGYGRPTPQFLQDQSYDENSGQLPVLTLQPASDSVHRRMSEPMPTGAASSTGGRTTASRSARTDVEEAAPLPSEGIAREDTFSGSGIHLGFDSPISHGRMRPSPVFVFNNRPMEMSSLEMEFDPEDWPLAFLNDIYQ